MRHPQNKKRRYAALFIKLMISCCLTIMLLSATVQAEAAEMVGNGIFNTSSSWTLATVTYDAGATATADGSGSLQISAVGRNTQSTGTATQTVVISAGSSISAAGDIILSAQQAWTLASSTTQTVTIDLRYADTSTVTVFTGTIGLNSSWSAIANGAAGFPLTLAQNVTEVIVTMDTRTGNDASATSDLWIDNLSITYTPAAGDTTPPTDGAALTATPGDTQNDLSWNAATDDTAVDHYRLVFLTGATPVIECTDGTEVYNGPALTSLHSGLSNGTTYNYRVCAYDAAGNVSTGLTASATPVAGATNTTAAGSASASVGNALIDVTAPYSDDANGNNTLLVEWGLDGVDCSLGSQPEAHAASPYTSQITGLTNGQAYQVCVTYVDADGVTGTNPQTTTGLTPTSFNPLIHSSLSTGSSKWGGDWGTATGKYGEFTCSTCHGRKTGNVKRVKKSLNSGTADNFPIEAGAGTVNFLDTRDGSSDFGDDTAGHATSDKICEGCHSQNKFHNYDTANNLSNGGDLNHENQQDCLACHQHSKGFGASCDGCHGNPPTTADTDGSTTTGLVHDPSPTGATSPASPGAHSLHAVTEGMACITCHKGNTMPTVSMSVQMGFEVNTTNWTGFGAAEIGGSLNVPQDGNLTNGFTYISGDGGTTAIVKQNINNPNCAVYCHGNWAGSNGQTLTDWIGGAAMVDDCNDCHGGSTATPPTAGSHTVHAGSGGEGLACNSCHPGYADTAHLDGDVAWDVSALSGTPTYSGSVIGSTGGKAPSGSYGSCAALYCHSSGQSADGTGTIPYVQATPTWGGAAACGSCHHVTTVAGLTTGSHSTHLAAAGIGCDDCHTGAASDASSYVSANHVNELIDAANSYNAGGAPGNGYGLCSAASCHDDGTGITVNSPIWGQSGGCASCHASDMATGSHTRHLSTTLYAKALCGDCHDGAVKDTTAPAEHTDGNLDVYAASAGDLGYPIINANGNGYESCSTAACHSTGQSLSDGSSAIPSYASVIWGGVAACGSCHAVAGLTSGGHAKHLAAAGIGCDDCHTNAATDASAYNSTAHVDGQIDAANSYNAGGAPGNGYGECANASCHDDGTGTTVNSPTWGQSVGCASCHASDMTTASHTTHLTQTISPAISCGHCHDGAVKDTTAPSQHVDGNLDVFDTVAGDLGYPINVAKGGAPYSSCTATYCHGDAMPNGDTTGSDTTPLWGASSTGCGFCHGFPPTPAGTHNGITLETQCGGCHDATMTSGFAGITDTSLHINGSIEVSASCTGCHNGGGSGATKVSENSPHANIAMNTATGGTISICEDCHFDAHGSRTTGTVGIIWDARTMGTDYTVDGKIYLKNNILAEGPWGDEAEVCWNCHNNYSISEWGTTWGAYDTGALDQVNWISAQWTSANFGYKTKNIRSVHETQHDTTASPGMNPTTPSHGATTVGSLANISCSVCHDVHAISNNGFTTGAKPWLRGGWTSNPFPEDGAPQTLAHATVWGGVPRAGLGASDPNLGNGTNALGGWQIEQNNPGAYTQVSNYVTHSGICANCHVQGDLEGAWSGHAAVVDGFTGGGGANIFTTTNRGGAGDSEVRGYMMHQNSPNSSSTKYILGLRSEYYTDNSYNPWITAGSDPQYSGIAEGWGVSVDAGTVDADFHQFSCSKCHNPHASRLPRLMITNCLDVVHNVWDDIAAVEDPSTFVGTNGTTTGAYTANQLAYSPTAANCHRYVADDDMNAESKSHDGTKNANVGELGEPGWNSVTPW